MSSVKIYGCRSHPWNNKPKQHYHEGNEIQHTLQKYQRLHDGLPPGVSEIQSECSHINYLCLKTPSLIFHTVRTQSSRKSRTQNRCSRTHRSNHSGTSIGGHTDRIKRSSLHLSRHGDVNGSQFYES